MKSTVTFAAVLLGLALNTNSWASECDTPRFRVGRVWEDTATTLLMTISISLERFAPGQMACLAEELARRYHGRDSIDILIFSDPGAAKYYTAGNQGDVDAPGFRWTQDALDRALHGIYVFNRVKNEHYMDIRSGAAPTTRLVAPFTARAVCRTSIAGRCLLDVDGMTYPRQAWTQGITASIRLGGRLKREGRIDRIRVEEGQEFGPLADASVANLRSWRVEPGTRDLPLSVVFSFVLDPAIEPERVVVDFNLPSAIVIRAGQVRSPRD